VEQDCKIKKPRKMLPRKQCQFRFRDG